MESTSIWFGPCRSKPQRPVVLTDEGFTVHLNAQDGKGNAESLSVVYRVIKYQHTLKFRQSFPIYLI